MEYSGLGEPYPAGRRLSKQERAHELKCKKKLKLHPRHQFCVIKMNSTFLESVDKWYAWKGMLSAYTIVTMVVSTSMLGLLVVEALMDAFGDKMTDIDRNTLVWFATAMGLMTFCYNLFATWLLRK